MPPSTLPRPPLPEAPATPAHEADETHHLVRTRSFPSSDVPTVLALLHQSRATGTLLIDLSSGGVGSIRFREEHKLSYDAK